METVIKTLNRSYTGTVDGLSMRPAQHGDFDNVLDIDRHLFLNLDYLHAEYHEYIDHPLRHCFVGEMDNAIVGFVMLYVVDDGRSVVDQSLRVSPTHQGKGIASFLIDKGVKAVMKDVPSIQRLLWTTVNFAATAKILGWNTKVKLLSKRHMQLCSISRDRLLSGDFAELLHNHKKKYQPPQISYTTSVIPKDDITSTISQIKQEDLDFLLPKHIWIINYDPYGHCKNNFDILVRDKTVTVVATQGNSCHTLHALSFGTLTRATSGYKMRVDFYHDSRCVEEVNVPGLFVTHFIRQVEHMIDQVGSDFTSEVSLGGLCYGEWNIEEFRKFLELIEVSRVAESFKHCYCIELKL